MAALGSIVAVVGVVALRSGAKTCPVVPVGVHGKIYGITSKDIGPRLPCATVQRVVRRWVARRYPRFMGPWTFAYHRDCQCRTATRTLHGRRVSFTFNST